jgi:hypothetical protein
MAETAAMIELSIGDGQTKSCSKLTHFEAPSAGFNHPLMSQNASHVIGSRWTNGEFATHPREAGLDPIARHHAAFSWSASAWGAKLSRRASKPGKENTRRIAITPNTMPTKRLQMTSSSVTGCGF